METGRIENRLTAVPESELPDLGILGSAGAPTLYEALSKADVRYLRANTYVSTKRTLEILQISKHVLRTLREGGQIEPAEEDWMHRYPSNFYRIADLRRVQADLDSSS